jgi:hypothetical protein
MDPSDDFRMLDQLERERRRHRLQLLEGRPNNRVDLGAQPTPSESISKSAVAFPTTSSTAFVRASSAVNRAFSDASTRSFIDGTAPATAASPAADPGRGAPFFRASAEPDTNKPRSRAIRHLLILD